jgi:uncharacterized protein
MSKPDPAGGSLENILASIRKSLSEQSTDALSETAAAFADQDKDTKPARKHGLTQRLAGATAGAPSADGAKGADLSDLLEDGQGALGKAAPEPASASAIEATGAAAPAASSDAKDPLWFLTRREEPVPESALPLLGAAPEPRGAEKSAADPAAETKLTRPEVLRASMPPFFGSSAEATTPTPVAVDPVAQASGSQVTRPYGSVSPTPAAPAGADAGMALEVSLVAAAAEAAATRPPQPAPQPAPNGRGTAVAQPPPGPVLAGDTPLTRALESVVLDLLRPMLRQWLDENMPRLVAEALSEEVQRTRAAKGDVKKT